jgi:hypothetical protein
MKKNLLFIFIALISIGLQAQTQRMVLVEQFTNASCGPCAGVNPGFTDLLDDNTDIVTYVKYQVSWPGTDPMYSDNPTQSGSRVSYYNVNSVPDASVDGGNTMNPSSITQTTLDNAAAIAPKADIKMFHEVTDDEIKVTMMVTALEPISGIVVAHIVLMEREINFASPPGSNGETEFHHVMKRMLPGSGGSSVPDLEVGEYYIIQESYPIDEINWYTEDLSELIVIGWVQENESKNVYQAANSSEDVFTPAYAVDAEIIDLYNVYENYCEENIQPGVLVRNNGADAITDLEITYMVNEGEEVVMNWTGNIAPFDVAEILLDESAFDLNADNILSLAVNSVNATDDEYPSNNDFAYEFPRSPLVNNVGINLYLQLDEFPEETTWEIINSDGAVWFEGGPYTTPGQVIQEEFELSVFDCYQFVIYDAGGNGICCDNGIGLYQLKDANNNVIGQSENLFTDQQVVNFRFDTDESVSNTPVLPDVVLYPNPASTELVVRLENVAGICEQVKIFNAFGQCVIEAPEMTYAEDQIFTFDVNGLAPGIYFVDIVVNGMNVKEKFIVNK